jgi:hypothetical protein
MTCEIIECENTATWRLGREEAVNVCDTCLKLPEMKRYKFKKALPKPLTKDLIGQCFREGSTGYLITGISDAQDALEVTEITAEAYHAGVRKTRLGKSFLTREHLAKITSEEFENMAKRAISILEIHGKIKVKEGAN